MDAVIRNPTDYRAGVGIVLLNSQGLIFTGKRRDGRRPPWQMPQGGIQAGELPPEAVRREIAEELGISAITPIAAHTEWLGYDYPTRKTSKRAENFRGQRHLWFLLRFDGEDRDIMLDRPHGEFEDWRWSASAEVIAGVVDFKRPVYRQVLQHFAPAIGRHSLSRRKVKI